MIEFLLAVLIAAFGQGAFDLPDFSPSEIISKIEEHIADVASPGTSVPLQSEVTPTPTANPVPGPVSTEVLQVTPDTSKVQAMNTQSGKVIESVAAVAVEKAPPLIPSPTSTPAPTTVIEPDPIPNPISGPTCPPMPGITRHPNQFDPPICLDSEI